MKIVTIKDFDDDEIVTSVINDIYTEDKVVINFHCAGGKDYLCDLLIREINNNKDKVIVYGSQLLSNGFWLFYHIKCEKIILKDCHILIHKGQCYENIIGNDYKLRKEFFNNQFKNEEPILKTFLTKKELKLYNRGGDVRIFDENRIKKIFNIE